MAGIVMHDIRFASWNLGGLRRPLGQIDLISRLGCDIVALQEVTAAHHQAILAAGFFEWAAFSLDKRPPQRGEGRHRRLGCAVYGRSPLRLHDFDLLDGVPFPEKGLVVRVATPAGDLTACSFHVPPGVTHGLLKNDAVRGLAAFLGGQAARTVVGIDANSPKRDRWDIEQNDWWRQDEPALLGPRPLHGLRDAFRLVLDREPAYRRFLERSSPAGPLDVSYIRGHGSGATRCRYDFIYVTPDIDVGFAQYRYAESLTAGSDHAIVLADLRLEAVAPPG